MIVKILLRVSTRDTRVCFKLQCLFVCLTPFSKVLQLSRWIVILGNLSLEEPFLDFFPLYQTTKAPPVGTILTSQSKQTWSILSLNSLVSVILTRKIKK